MCELCGEQGVDLEDLFQENFAKLCAQGAQLCVYLTECGREQNTKWFGKSRFLVCVLGENVCSGRHGRTIQCWGQDGREIGGSTGVDKVSSLKTH